MMNDNRLTFKQYVDNPTGAKTAVISYRKMYEDLYNDKWKKIMTREVGKIDYDLYYDNHDYYCYLKIPSENIDNFYYDVVIKMELNGKQSRLSDCPVQFFSNDPSFNYTFAHAFKKNKLTIKDLESKMSKEALMKPAREKNPQDTIGYVKTLYFAYIVMNEKGLFVPSLYTTNGQFEISVFAAPLFTPTSYSTVYGVVSNCGIVIVVNSANLLLSVISS